MLSTALLLCAVSAQAEGRAVACPGFEDRGASPEDADGFYILRSIDVLRAGLAGDLAKLRTLVSPKAEFYVWRADTGGSPRRDAPGALGRETIYGPEAAIWLARHIIPRRYAASADWNPIISVRPLRCRWSVTLLLTSEKRDEGYRITFDFVDGMMTSGKARFVAIFEGEIR
jgi:hypothetical protein